MMKPMEQTKAIIFGKTSLIAIAYVPVIMSLSSRIGTQGECVLLAFQIGFQLPQYDMVNYHISHKFGVVSEN